eukprot:6501348-Ditylum_brightwellii.AAC.1
MSYGKMSLTNDSTSCAYNRTIADYHVKFNPLPGGEQQVQDKAKATKMAEPKRKGTDRTNLTLVHKWGKQGQKISSTNDYTKASKEMTGGIKIVSNVNNGDNDPGQKTMAEVLANAVANATGAKMIYTYQTKIHFPIQEGKGPFNSRSKFSALMNELQQMERSVIMGSAYGEDNEWASTRELPTGD